MQGGYKDDLVVVLHNVIALSFQLPICVIYQDENTRSPEMCVFSTHRGHTQLVEDGPEHTLYFCLGRVLLAP